VSKNSAEGTARKLGIGNQDGNMMRDEYMPEPEYVYRFMDNEEHASAFLNGRIWVSTLSYCRRVEEDPGEGTDMYHSGKVEGHGNDPLLQHVAERAGFKIGPTVKNLTFWNNARETIDADAWVLCTTLNPDGYCRRKFGPFGVRIAQPVKFFRAISELMQREHNAGRCTIGAVEYGPRERYGTQKPIESRSFLKPAVPFAQEEELRMLWEQFDDARTLKRMTIDCPEEVRHLISPIP
jgi:hypothetical protein